MHDALDSFVESLKQEQENDQLLEHSPKKLTIAEKDQDYKGWEKLETVLKKVVEIICMDPEVRVETDTEEMMISVYGKDLGMAIGKNGKNIEALEHIINLIAARQKLTDTNIAIDIKDYRKKKAEKVKKTALKMAEKAAKEGIKIKLKPMSAFERKVVHNALAGFKNIKTISKNREPYRRIVIYPVQENQ